MQHRIAPAARLAAIALALCAAAPALADTLYLNNGTRVHGIARELPNGLIELQAGPRRVIYRPEEVQRIERNDKTGHFDREAAEARRAERDRELTEATGLNAEQRRIVRTLLYELQLDDRENRAAIREQLRALQSEMDVYRYAAYLYPGMSHRLAPWVLEAMYYLDPARTRQLVRDELQHTYFGVRAMAIAIAGRTGDAASLPLVLRGLADPFPEVQIEAALAAGSLGARHASPALLDLLDHNDLRVGNAARRSLASLWDGMLPDPAPESSDDWRAFWRDTAASRVNNPVRLASLAPLVDPQFEFEDE